MSTTTKIKADRVNHALREAILAKYETITDFSFCVGRKLDLVSGSINGSKTITERDKHKWAEMLDCQYDELFGNGIPGRE